MLLIGNKHTSGTDDNQVYVYYLQGTQKGFKYVMHKCT